MADGRSEKTPNQNSYLNPNPNPNPHPNRNRNPNSNSNETEIQTKTKAKTQAGEPARGARSAPRVGVLPRCAFAFNFVFI